MISQKCFRLHRIDLAYSKKDNILIEREICLSMGFELYGAVAKTSSTICLTPIVIFVFIRGEINTLELGKMYTILIMSPNVFVKVFILRNYFLSETYLNFNLNEETDKTIYSIK